MQNHPTHRSQYRIEPNCSSSAHNHDEPETVSLLSGQAELILNGKSRRLVIADSVCIPSFVTHQIKNLGSNPCVYQSDWKRPDMLNPSLTPKKHNSVIAISATPPTPNGDLHLGHLSGPYLAADILARFQRMQGTTVRFFSGLDSNQSYVDLKASLTNMQHLNRDSECIEKSFSDFGISYNQFYRAHQDENYPKMIVGFFQDLFAKGVLTEEKTALPYCGSCDRHVSEAFIRGACPHCNAACDGHSCEACGLPNQGVDMHKATCKLCNQSVEARLTNTLQFQFERWMPELAEYWCRLELSPRARDFLAHLKQSKVRSYPIALPSFWGIEWNVPLRITAWAEMAAGYSNELGRNGQKHEKYVQFFGYDNIFYHLVLIPGLLIAKDLKQLLADQIEINEFLQLDGLKFSTSRNHAIWAQEFLPKTNISALRSYLLQQRPSKEQKNFTLDDYCSFQSNFESLHEKILKNINNATTFTEQKDFETELSPECWKAIQEVDHALKNMTTALNESPICFSTVAESLSFMRNWLKRAPNPSNLYLCIASSYAKALFPVAPELACKIWDALGYEEDLSQEKWDDAPRFINTPYLRAPRVILANSVSPVMSANITDQYCVALNTANTRKLWTLIEGDVLITSTPPSEEIIQYVFNELGIRRESVLLVSPEHQEYRLLVQNLLHSPSTLDSIRNWTQARGMRNLFPFVHDTLAEKLAAELELNCATGVEGVSEIVKELNSKKGFKAFCSLLTIPTPEWIFLDEKCSDTQVEDFFNRHEKAILKPNRNTNGFDTRVCTRQEALNVLARTPGRFILEELLSVSLTPSVELSLSVNPTSVEYISEMDCNDFTWKGDIIPAQKTSTEIIKYMEEAAIRFGRELFKCGYRGSFDLDGLVTSDGRWTFTECNIRNTGGTALHRLMRRKFGKRYHENHICMSDRIPRGPHSFKDVVQRLRSAGVLFNGSEGAFLTTDGSAPDATIRYFLTAQNWAKLHEIQNKLTQSLI